VDGHSFALVKLTGTKYTSGVFRVVRNFFPEYTYEVGENIEAQTLERLQAN